MNITPSNRTITEYHMTLSEQDAREAVTDSHAFGERLAEQLRTAGAGPLPLAANGGGAAHKAHKPKPVSRFKLKSSTQAAITRGKAMARRPKARAASALQCPHCPKSFKYQAYLTNHLRKAHSNVDVPVLQN